jgi:hypothetical protein
MEGIPGAIPAAKITILRAENLRPTAALSTGIHAIGKVGKVGLTHVHDGQYTVVRARRVALKCERRIRVIFVRNVEGLAAQSGILPAHPVWLPSRVCAFPSR